VTSRNFLAMVQGRRNGDYAPCTLLRSAEPVKGSDYMRRGLGDPAVTSGLLAALALCTLLISLAFFMHWRHDPMSDEVRGHLLPGLTIGAAGPSLTVTSIRSGGEAARHGVAVGDVIVAIDGKSFRSLDQAEAYLISQPGDDVVLELRGNRGRHVVALGRARS